MAEHTRNIEIARLWTTWTTIVGGDNGNRLLLCRACTDVSIHDTRSSGGGYIKTDSSADGYPNVNTANSSYRIHAARNVVDGRTGPKGGVQAAWYSYTWDVDDVEGSVSNAGLAFSWWGGNNNVDWVNYDRPPKAGRMRFSGESAFNVTAGWWGSMSEDITVTKVHADGCEDVCLDSEGDNNVNFSHFFATGAANGELATFFHSRSIGFRDGEVLHRLASKGFSYFNNNATNDSTMSRDVSMQRLTFRCGDPDGICAISLDPLTHLTIRDSTLKNTRIANSVDAPEQGSVSILSSTFTVDRAGRSPWRLLDLTTRGYGDTQVCGNLFRSLVQQPPGTTVVYADNHYNLGRAGDVTIAGNTAENYFPVHLSLRSSGDLHPTLLFGGNGLDTKKVIVSDNQFDLHSFSEAQSTSFVAVCRKKPSNIR